MHKNCAIVSVMLWHNPHIPFSLDQTSSDLKNLCPAIPAAVLRISWAPLGKLEKAPPLGGSRVAGPRVACWEGWSHLSGHTWGRCHRGHDPKAWKIPEGKRPLVSMMGLVIWNIFHHRWAGGADRGGQVFSWHRTGMGRTTAMLIVPFPARRRPSICWR